ncbi:MAG: type II toxin-antitoxin system VapC family toxin [Verrucomicrobiota bacterium]
MTEYLLDTNVVSELRKGRRCDERVAVWHSTLAEGSTWLSVVVLAEIWRGVEQLRRKDPIQSSHLERWFTGLKRGYPSRILPVNEGIAIRWGSINASNRLPFMDGFLAATALEHNLVLATRNVADVRNCGVRYVNPFAFLPSESG